MSNVKRKGRRKRRNILLTELTAPLLDVHYGFNPVSSPARWPLHSRAETGEQTSTALEAEGLDVNPSSAIYLTAFYFCFLSYKRRITIGEAYRSSSVIGAGQHVDVSTWAMGGGQAHRR